ncbi:MAG: hypothetical protein E5V74_00170 [Mesorhizobium sp.]|nr:MAG: hypothetical protein E5W03_00095 [Mesorhizobium sp.]TIV25242.1 MAG: hypothetical protein E5W02_00145 [Mesorhizobium sp.]TIV68128.1 MAG: hypothetical protein E5V86_02185 [Mesorhizobium sp.]TIW06068.1 MAG: hypothetical protein E5V74_00170 [Mesorhizobium sp.]
MANAIGLIGPERMANIPPKFHAHHEFCFHLHDNIAAMTAEMEAANLRTFSFKLDSQDDVEALRTSANVLQFLADSGRMDIAQKSTVSELNLAVYADLLHFLFGALQALEKRKFTVAYAMLRKPLKENLLYAAWMVADENDFFQRMRDDPSGKLVQNGDKIRDILYESIKHIKAACFFDGDLIYRMIYDKDFDIGLCVPMNKANHLVTNRGERLKTDKWDLNYIFKDFRENDVYETIYPILAYLLAFIQMLQIASYSRLKDINEEYYKYLTVSTIGAYDALFAGNKGGMASHTNRLFKEHMTCPFCKSGVRIKKAEAARFFILEYLSCKSCGHEHRFPLYWLLSKTEWTVSDTDGTIQAKP